MEQRIEMLERRVDAIESQIRVNTATIQSIKNDTSEIVTLMKSSKIGGRIVLWIAMVASACMSTYAALKDVLHSKP